MEDIFLQPKEDDLMRVRHQEDNPPPECSAELELCEYWKEKDLPTSLPKGNFFWQYRLGLTTYERIKELLIALDLGKNTKLVKRYSFHIALYLAEWFKREYDGYLCERGLDQLGISSIKSKLIWENAHFDESYLINSGQNEWLFSMYVLGGFPVKYVCRVTRFDALFKSIWTIRQGDEIDEEVINDISNSFDSNNSVYQMSLLPGGSLFEYINRIIDEDCPLADEDIKIEPYSDFCDLLNKGKRYCFDNFFGHELRFYTDGESEGLDTEFYVQIGFKKNRCYIPEDCVKGWQVLGDCSKLIDFDLGLQTDNGEKSSYQIRFSKTGKEKTPYVGWGTLSSLFVDIDIARTKEIYVNLYSIDDLKHERGKTIKSIKIKNHYQVYQTNDPYCWSSKVNNQSISALLFSPQKYKLVDASSQINELVPLYGENMNWCWVRIFDSVIISDYSGTEYHFSAYKGAIGVLFKTSREIKYNKAGEVEYTYFDEDEEKTISLPVMLGPNGIKSVKFYPFEHDKTTTTLKRNQYRVEYKQDDFNFQEFNGTNAPKCGITRLRITDCSGVHSKTIKCYYLPTADIFKRKLQERTINFLSHAIPLWSMDDDGLFHLNEGLCIFDDTKYDQEEDYVPFRIGTKDAFITLNVARSNDCKEVYFKGRYLTKLDRNQNVEIPLILKDQFAVRNIGVEGVTRSQVGKERLLDYQFVSGYNRYKSVTEIDNTLGVMYYLYKDMRKEIGEELVLNISPKQRVNYIFYFWSLEKNEPPIRIESYYDEENSTLTVPTAMLERRGGMVFQSLKTALPPNYVFPSYSKNEVWSFLTKKNYQKETYLRAFDIASEHNIYFSQFPPFFVLIERDNRNDLIAMALTILRKTSSNQRKIIQDLHRFANEFAFDWFLLPWSLWKNNCRSQLDRYNAELLFRQNPHIKSQSERTYLDMVLRMYWTLPNSKDWRFGRKEISKYLAKIHDRGILENLALQAIRGKKMDFFLLKSKNSRGENESYEFNYVSKFLLAYWSSERIFCDIYNFINDKIYK